MNMVNFPEHWNRAPFGEAAAFTKKPRNLHYSEYDEVPFVPMDLIPIAKLFSEKFTLKTNDELSSGTYLNLGTFFSLKLLLLLKMVNSVLLRICQLHLALQRLK